MPDVVGSNSHLELGVHGSLVCYTQHYPDSESIIPYRMAALSNLESLEIGGSQQGPTCPPRASVTNRLCYAE